MWWRRHRKLDRNAQEEKERAQSETGKSVVQDDKKGDGVLFPMKHSEYRYSSFIEFPCRVSWPMSSFVESGFFYTGICDVVECFCCGVTIGNWSGTEFAGGVYEGMELSGSDYPLLRHIEENMECDFVNKRLVSKKDEYQKLNEVYTKKASEFINEDKDMGLMIRVLQRNQQRNMLMSCSERRLNTYTNAWPRAAKKTKEELSQAGFYYTGKGDIVRCFDCDVSLADWESDDDPIEEHAKYSQMCNYIKQYTGRHKEKEILAGSESQSDDIDNECVSSSQLVSEVDTIMDTKCMKSICLKSKFDLESIKTAVTRKPELAKMLAAPMWGNDLDSNLDEFLETVRSTDMTSASKLNSDRIRRRALIDDLAELSLDKVNFSEVSVSLTEPKAKTKAATEQSPCCVCLDRKRSAIFVPCGHLSTCLTCGQKMKRCPICRRKPEKILSVFVS